MVREFGVLDTNGQTFPPMSSDAHYLPREGGGSSAIHTRRQTHNTQRGSSFNENTRKALHGSRSYHH